jgi:hypothetical protein
MIAFSSHPILQISSVLSIFNHLILMVRTITFVEQADTSAGASYVHDDELVLLSTMPEFYYA